MTTSSPKKRPPREAAVVVQPSSPRFPLASGSHNRKIGIAVDLSHESAYAVKWAVQNYLRSGDAVILVHVRPTSVLYGADWGAIDLSIAEDRTQQQQQQQEQQQEEDSSEEHSQKQLEDNFDVLTNAKVNDLAQPLVEANIPFKTHIVKDHDMKERLCLEVERLGLSAVVMGSRGFGASRKSTKGRLGSVSDYCVHHCVCPVIVVRYPDEEDAGDGSATAAGGRGVLCPVAEAEEEGKHLEASDEQADLGKSS